MSRAVTLKSPAKLNLLLGVTPQIVAGRHLLTSVFTTISLADTLTFCFDGTRERLVTIEVVSDPAIPPLNLHTEDNIIYQAVQALEGSCNRELGGHLHVMVEKRIPSEGGLAGGSSNAAATLKMLAGLWGLKSHSEKVLNAARLVGADVPFFLYGGCALMGGNGGELVRGLPQPALDLVLVKPPVGVSTGKAYEAFDADPQPLPPLERLIALLDTPGAAPWLLAQEFANNLSRAACSLAPELEEIIGELAAQPGVYTAQLTGSGSTIFGVCESTALAAGLARYFTQQGYWSIACSTL
ncbi:MAG: 4-(cytidine 5'-diphospho)-2-C-methyl-D-erythritol kinase [Coriobacteriales bacterium]|jgi:4-diphosphocytidyl-2-C-methyl-D-erythritol kinase|nr:4-(cytidine 5'-diphospho)-2-C-methyl-D-erythritol kinase [Coriobacteriales bacterium]